MLGKRGDFGLPTPLSPEGLPTALAGSRKLLLAQLEDISRSGSMGLEEGEEAAAHPRSPCASIAFVFRQSQCCETQMFSVRLTGEAWRLRSGTLVRGEAVNENVNE